MTPESYIIVFEPLGAGTEVSQIGCLLKQASQAYGLRTHASTLVRRVERLTRCRNARRSYRRKTGEGLTAPAHSELGRMMEPHMAKTRNIAAQLREAIAAAERHGITRAQIATSAGMTRAMVYRIADGQTIPRLDTAERITKAMKLRLQIVSN